MAQDVKAIVIACNTATSACVNLLRDKYPIDIIGMEPALKVACEKVNIKNSCLGNKSYIKRKKVCPSNGTL